MTTRYDEILTVCGSDDQLKNAKSCLKLADETAQYSPKLAAAIREVGESMINMRELAKHILKDRTG
jgi:hypothetical protein